MRDGAPTLRSVYVTGACEGEKDFHAWPHDRPFRARCQCRGPLSYYDAEETRPVNGACKNTCGIYSWADEFFAVEPVKVHDWLGATMLVHGEVYLWGKIKVHERGYRAEYAKVASLWSLPSNYAEAEHGVARFASAAAEHYGAMFCAPPEWLTRPSYSEQSATTALRLALDKAKVSITVDAGPAMDALTIAQMKVGLVSRYGGPSIRDSL